MSTQVTRPDGDVADGAAGVVAEFAAGGGTAAGGTGTAAITCTGLCPNTPGALAADELAAAADDGDETATLTTGGEEAAGPGVVVTDDDEATGGKDGDTRLAAGVVAGMAGVVSRLAFCPGGGTPVAPSWITDVAQTQRLSLVGTLVDVEGTSDAELRNSSSKPA